MVTLELGMTERTGETVTVSEQTAKYVEALESLFLAWMKAYDAKDDDKVDQILDSASVIAFADPQAWDIHTKRNPRLFAVTKH